MKRNCARYNILLPLITIILIVGWISHSVNKDEEMYYDSMVSQVSQQVDNVVDNIDDLIDTFNFKNNADMQIKLLFNPLKIINDIPGVSINVINENFEIVKNEYSYYFTHNSYHIFCDSSLYYNNSIIREKFIKSIIYKNGRGYHIVSFKENSKIKFYFRQVPTLNKIYYIIVGVDKNEIIKNINPNNVAVALIFVLAFVIVNTFQILIIYKNNKK